MVSAFALIVWRPIDGSFAQNGHCWRIQADVLRFPKNPALGEQEESTW